MPRSIREAIKIGYVEQALRLKKKLQRALKLIWVLSGMLAVALAVLLQVLDYRSRLKPSEEEQEPEQEQETESLQ